MFYQFAEIITNILHFYETVNTEDKKQGKIELSLTNTLDKIRIKCYNAHRDIKHLKPLKKEKKNMYDQYEPDNTYVPQEAEPPKGKAIISLIFGIVSIYLGAIPGIILAIIGKRNAIEYLEENPAGPAAGLAKVGKILCSIGLPVSIVSLIILAILCIILIIEYIILFALEFGLLYL